MIVKNESSIIERLLDSVISIIDTYCICDTGSTDDTIDRIERYMSTHTKQGIVFSEPFQNFGYNRTIALERASSYGEYALLLDADMILVSTSEFSNKQLQDDGYYILQKMGDIEYYNIRIVKTGIGIRCIGPTHEHYTFPSNHVIKKLTTVWVEDIGDGGAKENKFNRDIRLLEESIGQEPTNERYYFYLANSYKNIREFHKALDYYKQRVKMGGWIEELFYACYEAGNCYKELEDMPNAVFWWMEAYHIYPTRSESLYELTRYYREKGKHGVSQIFCSIGHTIPYPTHDVLFIKKDVYTFLFDYEQSILSYYTHVPINHYTYIRLLEQNFHKDTILSNYSFYVKKLIDMSAMSYDFCEKIEKPIMGRMDSFCSSTPCILPYGNGYLMNVCYVNYTILQDGRYMFQHSDGKITSLHKTLWLNQQFEVEKGNWIDRVQNEELQYQGIEDVKLFQHDGTILVLGTIQDPNTSQLTLTVGFGNYILDGNCIEASAFQSPHGYTCEKNWCYAHNQEGKLYIVYTWSPLTVCIQEGNKLKEYVKHTSIPRIFQDLRGSSNGCLVKDEIWFLTHLVQYSSPRKYYHMIVILDATSFAYKRHSILFKFHGDCIEYGLGLIVEEERMVLSYSRMDCTSSVICLQRDIVERELFPIVP